MKRLSYGNNNWANCYLQGLHYIHTSPIHSHGHMRSSDCLIDGRWVLKIGNVGQVSIKKKNVVKKEAGEYKTFRGIIIH